MQPTRQPSPAWFHRITINNWDSKRFHAHNTPNGTSHNSVVIIDEHTTVIDTAPQQFSYEFLEQVKKIAPYESIEYIVIQHVEQESSGCLQELYSLCPRARIVCTRKCYEHITIMFSQLKDAKFEIVGPHEPLVLGSRSLIFRPTPLVHFPEQMITVILPEQILLSSDLFAQSLAQSYQDFTSAIRGLIMEKAEEFAANTFSSVTQYVQQTISWIEEQQVKAIIPNHGYPYREQEDVESVVRLYQQFIKAVNHGSSIPKILIVYESMWGATARMADHIGVYFKNNGVNICMLDMRLTTLEKLAHEAITATGFCFGSPTLNGGAMPGIIEAINYLRGARLVHGKRAIVFGSYGWGTGEGSKFIMTQLERANIKVYGRVIWKFNFDRSSEEEMEKLLEEVFGRTGENREAEEFKKPLA